MKKNQIIIGIDVSKATLDCYIQSTAQHFIVENGPKGFVQLLETVFTSTNCQKGDLLVCFENTGKYSKVLSVFMQSQGISFVMAPALEIKKSLGITRGKNDKIDSCRIANYAYEKREKLKPTILPGERIDRIKSLLSLREKLVKHRTAYKNGISDLQDCYREGETRAIKDIQQRLINGLNDEIDMLETEIESEIKHDPSMEISNNETNNSNYYEFHNKLNSGLPLFIAPTAYYKETDKKQNNISIRYYFHNADTALNNSIIKESLKAIDFCVHYIGSYNRTQLTYIEFPTFPMAQSLETFLMMGTDFIKMFGKYPDMKFWVAHETIHQWIGVGYFDAIYTSPKYSRFIEESLTEYVRYIYLEKNFGKDSLAGQIKDVVNIYNKQIKGTDQDVPVSSNSPNRVTYCVGPLIFHVVSIKIGENNWQKFISSLYSKYYGKIIDYEIFKKELSVYAVPTVISNMENELEAKGIPKEIASH